MAQGITPLQVHQYIEQYFLGVGLTKDQVYDAKNETYYWRRGSANLEMFITRFEVTPNHVRYYLRIFSPLMLMPATQREHIYRTLLQISHNSLCVKITMREGSEYIFAAYERDIEGMDYIEFYNIIADMEWWADSLDDRLKSMFPDQTVGVPPTAGGAPPQL